MLDEADPMRDAPAMLSAAQLWAKQQQATAAAAAAAAAGPSPTSAASPSATLPSGAGASPGQHNAMGEGMHSAGYDARCTGYLLAYQALSAALSQQGQSVTNSNSNSNSLAPTEDGLGWLKRTFGNNLYLTGKDFPLKVVKTQFGGGRG